MNESTNGNVENNPSMTWEETDSNGVQLQSASCEWEQFESQEDAGNSPTFSEKGRYAEWVQDMKEEAEWDMENLTQQDEASTTTQAAPKLHIVMMDCGNGPEDPDQNEYSSLDQFQEISKMLVDNVVCEIFKPNKLANVHDFEQILEQSLMHGMPTILQINAESHTADGILYNDTRWPPNQMAASIEAATQNYRHNLKAIILNVPDARYLAYELKTDDTWEPIANLTLST